MTLYIRYMGLLAVICLFLAPLSACTNTVASTASPGFDDTTTGETAEDNSTGEVSVEDSGEDTESSTAGSLVRLEAENAEIIPAGSGDDPDIHEDHVAIYQEGGVSFTVTTASRTRYSLVVIAKANSQPKTNDVKLDGAVIASFTISTTGEWLELVNAPVTLEAGTHTIEICATWGWIEVDCIELRPPVDTTAFYSVVKTLANTNASDPAKRLMSFIVDNYGEKIIAGQMDLSWREEVDMAGRVLADTGKYPALMGYDFGNIRHDNWGGGGTRQTTEALEWGRGLYNDIGTPGIVSFCWHWRVPVSGTIYNGEDAFYTKETVFRIPLDGSGAIDTGSAAYTDVIKADLDLVAAELQRLEDAGIPVLWRPLHEASGEWFWWGASGPAAFKALWIHLYEYFTLTKGLDNLVWVWNGQAADWYPGDEYVDIIGQDIYPGPREYASQAASWLENVQYSDDPVAAPKPVALTENGAIPDPELCAEDGALWSWFMTWNDGANDGDDENNFWTGEYHNGNSHKTYVYNHERVITLDELPDLGTYQY